MKVLVTGAAGFIAGYLVPELLRHQHQVVGVDNFSKYGPVKRSYDGDPGYQLVEGDAKNVDLLSELALSCDQVVAGAAMIGGISYFHEFAYDLLAENERILAATFDAAINACRHGRLKRIAVISSSMVFESAAVFHFFCGFPEILWDIRMLQAAHYSINQLVASREKHLERMPGNLGSL